MNWKKLQNISLEELVKYATQEQIDKSKIGDIYNLSYAEQKYFAEKLRQAICYDSTLVRNNSFESLHVQANSEVKEWLNNFVKFLKRKNVAQEKIDNLFASWLISIVGNGYLKLWDVIIGKNQNQAIQ